MHRYRMIVEYDGSQYVGWQRQDNGPSVQGAIEKAILGASGETVSIRGAGRTDSGVHAMGQVVHADLSKEWAPFKLQNALNAHLRLSGERVAILEVESASEHFDARFSALRRHYLYRIISRRAPLALEAGKAGGWPRRSITTPCMPPRRHWSASMTSPPSAPLIVRQTARCAPSTGWMWRARET
jgi:tRNA pseudouridine38-40 synthase